MSINNSCESIQARLKAELAEREKARLAALQGQGVSLPIERSQDAIIEAPKALTDETASAPEINFEDPQRLEFEALPDEDLKALAAKHNFKYKSFDRNKLIDSLVMKSVKP